MEEGIYIRMAVLADLNQFKESIKRTMTNPDGKGTRKGLKDAIERRELLVLERVDPKDKTAKVSAFIEWYTKVDGTVTIRDIGTVGDEPNEGMARRIIRELLRLVSPPEATVKLRADLPIWNGVFQGIPGFQLEGREYSRPYWRAIWRWTPEAERIAHQRERIPRGIRR